LEPKYVGLTANKFIYLTQLTQEEPHSISTFFNSP